MVNNNTQEILRLSAYQMLKAQGLSDKEANKRASEYVLIRLKLLQAETEEVQSGMV